MAMCIDLNETRVNLISSSIRKNEELNDEQKSDLYMFLGELYCCMKLLDTTNNKEN